MSNPIHILLVEDNPGDIKLTRKAFIKAKVANQLDVVSDGVSALAYLRDETIPHPGLILLDLKLPRMSGLDVLEAIKTDPGLKHIPVIVLSSSRAETDITKSYSSHANAYVTKPITFNDFMKVVESTGIFWLTIVSLPSAPN